MGFNISLNINRNKKGKKSGIIREISNMDRMPDIYSDEWIHYIIGDGSRQDKATLLDMVEKHAEFATPMNYAVRTTARIPVKHINSKGLKVENSPYIELLETPNQFQKSMESLMEAAILSYLATGDCYFNKIGAPYLIPSKLFVLDPTCTEPIWTKEKDFRFKELKAFKTLFPEASEYTLIDAQDVAHIMFTGAKYNQMTYGGVSILVPLIENYKNLKKNYIARRSMYEGKRILLTPRLTEGALPGIGGIYPQEGENGDSEYAYKSDLQRVSEKLNNNWRADNPHGERIKIISTPMDVAQIGSSAKELGLDESRSADFRFISMQIGVHPILTGDTTNAALNNYKIAERQFYLTTALPIAYKFYSELTTFLNLPAGELLVPDISNIEALKDDRIEAHRMILENYDRNAATANEIREAAGQLPAEEYNFRKILES